MARPESPPAPGFAWATLGLLIVVGVVDGFFFSSPHARIGPGPWTLPGVLAVLAVHLLAIAVLVLGISKRSAARDPDATTIRALAAGLATRADSARGEVEPEEAAALEDLAESIERLRRQAGSWGSSWSSLGDSSADFRPKSDPPSLSAGGLVEAPPSSGLFALDPNQSGAGAIHDMVARLEPRTLRWLDASPALEAFLGWPLPELRRLSFLDVVHPDHVDLAREQLLAALGKGEAHGLIYRIRAAGGQARAIAMNLGVRYGPDLAPNHLRCHVTDVTDKLRAGRELRRRTRELTLANEQLRRTNREVQELKDRYSDLYQNAPAMYFSLDERGDISECNNTLLGALGYRREDLIGRPYTVLLPRDRHAIFDRTFAEFLRTGYVEIESRWTRADGSTIDVWVTGTAVRAPDGSILHSRSVGQDVTARKALEAELREKHERLARANEQLSRKNRELDEFTYVVSHDLQEPLRTLIAFSDFLLSDYGDRLDDEGRENVRYLMDASRRMRSLIDDLLRLSRAGRVTADLGPVDLGRVVEVVLADLAELIRTRRGRVEVVGPLPTVWGDPDRLGQLFANLIANGLKYNEQAEPRVQVGAEASGPDGPATVFVRDDGIGIEPGFHGKVFQMFRRLHARDEYEGTGAGLAIAQKIAQAHGGQIWLESEPGRGSTFFVRLPRRAAPATRGPLTEILHAP